jgi:hypothetical protein
MKAALNGVLSLRSGRLVDRGHIEYHGLPSGTRRRAGWQGRPVTDAAALYDKLERAVIPTFYREWVDSSG